MHVLAASNCPFHRNRDISATIHSVLDTHKSIMSLDELPFNYALKSRNGMEDP